MKQPPCPSGGERSHDMENLLRGREIPSGMLPSMIAMSWERCIGYGLDHEGASEFDPDSYARLHEQQESHQSLLEYCTPAMDLLFEQIKDSNSVIVLANDQGYILDSRGDAQFLERAKRVALTPGIEWSETTRGTNAIGTALAVNQPVVVHGQQHFLTANQSLTCSAAPIHGPEGRILGLLDVTGDHRSYNPHTLALVRTLVQQVENRLFSDAYRQEITLCFHQRQEYVGSLCQGMTAFSQDGRLLAANQSACDQLGTPLEQLRDQHFTQIFGLPLSRLFDHHLTRPGEPLTLTLCNGQKVIAKANFHALHRQHIIKTRGQGQKRNTYTEMGKASTICPLQHLSNGDPQMTRVVNKARKLLGHDISIMIQGETGTGKEVLARAIHQAGPRAKNPFVAVNCAAIPEGLIESELFGYEEGAFTGARRKGSIGKILQANRGILFLDEIGDMPLALQARLLRVLEERRVTPLGSAKSYPVDISLLCATHRRLREQVQQGEFREDLYFRLNGITLNLPPLRDREDLHALIELLLKEHHGKDHPILSPQLQALFERHPWPGNIRQLSNVLHIAGVMAEDEAWISHEHLPDDFLDEFNQDTGNTTRPQSLHLLAQQGIEAAIERNNGNLSAAARELGISRATLYRKRRKPPQKKG